MLVFSCRTERSGHFLSLLFRFRGQDLSSLLVCLLIFGPLLLAQSESARVQDLARLSLEELLQVPVISPGKRPLLQDEAPAVVTLISREEIEAAGALNLFDLLQRASSVLMLGSHFYPRNLLSMRGDLRTHANNHTLVLIDGRPLRESVTGGQDFPVFLAFPLLCVERIELVRGPGSVLYGSNAFSAVLNVVTRGSTGQEAQLRFGESGAGLLEGMAGGRLGSWQLSGGFRLQREGDWRFAASDHAGTYAAPLFSGEHRALLLNARSSSSSFDALLLDSQQDFMGAVASWGGTPSIDERAIRGKRLRLGFGKLWQSGTGLDGEFHLAHLSSRFDHYNYGMNHDDVVGEWLISGRSSLLRWQSGVEFTHRFVSTSPGLAAAPIPPGHELEAGLYGQLEADPLAKLHLLAGLQASKREAAAAHWVPRGALIYRPDRASTLKLLHAQAYRSPYALETRFNLILRDDQGQIVGGLRGNPHLQPEEVESTDLHFQRSQHHLVWALTAFHQRQSQLIQRVRAQDQVLDYLNGDSLLLQGLEAEFRAEPAPGWLLQFNGTYQRNESAQKREDVTLMPNLLAKLALHYHGTRLRLALADVWHDGYHSVTILNPGASEINPDAGASHWLSFHSAWRLPKLIFGSQLDLELHGDNLLDELHTTPEFVGRRINTIPAGPGRSIQLGLRLTAPQPAAD
jgi:outer membrane receptor protein involved in Fe transport